jgi:hypothetical protein
MTMTSEVKPEDEQVVRRFKSDVCTSNELYFLGNNLANTREWECMCGPGSAMRTVSQLVEDPLVKALSNQEDSDPSHYKISIICGRHGHDVYIMLGNDNVEQRYAGISKRSRWPGNTNPIKVAILSHSISYSHVNIVYV